MVEGDVDLLASDEYWDPHAIAGLLKSFLRELPASILTRDLHLRFLAVIGMCDNLVTIISLTPCGRFCGSPRKDYGAFPPDSCIANRELQSTSSINSSLDLDRAKFQREQDDHAERWDRV